MKTKLTTAEKNFLLPLIQEVLDGGPQWEAKLMHHPAGAIIEAIASMPGVKKKADEDNDRCQDGFDTNGWQWDWWQRFSYKGKDYTLAGSGWYGGHSFALADE